MRLNWQTDRPCVPDFCGLVADGVRSPYRPQAMSGGARVVNALTTRMLTATSQLSFPD